MIRKTALLLVLSFSLILGGCIDVLEEMTLNADGSGSYLLRYDLSSMLSDPSMRELMESSMKGENGEDESVQLENMDTIIRIYDNLDPSVENREFWKNVQVHMVMNSTTNVFKVDFLLEFTSVEDVAYMYENLSSVSPDGESMTQISSMLPGSPQFSQAKSKLTRKSTEKEQPSEEEENMAMVEMFLAGAKHTCVYHLPGQVSKVNIAKAKIEGNTVTVENSLLDAMKGQAKLDGSIKFK